MPQQPQQNFDAMRQDAIRRSREMQRRAMPSPPVGSSHERDDIPPQQSPETIPPEPPPPPPKPPNAGGQGLLQSLKLPEELNTLLTEWNGEKLALAALLYLLYKEGADVSLLLAMAYILL